MVYVVVARLSTGIAANSRSGSHWYQILPRRAAVRKGQILESPSPRSKNQFYRIPREGR
jgi:hypothetical protein